MILDQREYTTPATRRDCIRQGWDQYQSQGWKAKSPYIEADPRWHVWMNGMEGAAQHQRNLAYSKEDVLGWT